MSTATLDRQATHTARSDHAESRGIRLADSNRHAVHAGCTSATVGGEDFPVELARADELFQLGYVSGRMWAADVASRDQLENLVHLADQLGDEAASFFVFADKSPARSCDLFADTAGPALGGDAVGRRKLWKAIAVNVDQARVWTRPEFVAGTFAGAVDAWRSIRSEL
ncbi:hypothetical protein [Singulisphaera sp. PoT]|uniref:hypothetical protein n=1 Tax=Singulisphaera sp. PoT TaxID=3411797 RepID=UPI003BF46875